VTLGTITATGTGGGANGVLQSINLSGVAGTAASTLTLANNTMAAATVVTAAAGGTTITTGAEQAADTLIYTGAAGVDTINAGTFTGLIVADGKAGADIIVGGAGADTLTGGEGTDTITGGAGVDAINLTEVAGVLDIVVINNADLANANRDVVTGFAVATDRIQVNMSAAQLLNAGGATLDDGAVTGEFLVAAAGAVTQGAANVIIELNYNFDSEVSLASATKTTLLSAIGAADNAITGVTASTITLNAGAQDAILIAYQSGNAYLFRVTSGADADVTVADADDLVVLVGTYNGIAVGGFDFGNFIA
jgi:hypothetical protein